MAKLILDHQNLIIFARISGFIDVARILRITADADDAARQFGCRAGLHGRLFDLTDAKVAPPAAIDALGEMTIDPARMPVRANRVAYFGASPLAQLQLKRLCALRPSMAIFDDRSAAFAWAIGGRPTSA